MRKIDIPKDGSYDSDWIGNPSCENQREVEKYLIENRSKIQVIFEIVDDTLSYEYDEMALVLLNRKYYLLQTSGCSCPSPTETWGVDIGPATLKEIKEFIQGGHYSGYSLPKREESAFISAINAEILRTKRK